MHYRLHKVTSFGIITPKDVQEIQASPRAQSYILLYIASTSIGEQNIKRRYGPRTCRPLSLLERDGLIRQGGIENIFAVSILLLFATQTNIWIEYNTENEIKFFAEIKLWWQLLACPLTWVTVDVSHLTSKFT